LACRAATRELLAIGMSLKLTSKNHLGDGVLEMQKETTKVSKTVADVASLIRAFRGLYFTLDVNNIVISFIFCNIDRKSGNLLEWF